MKSEAKSTGAVALVTGGIAAVFALAACCALPILLAGMGLSAYWLAPVAAVGVRFSGVLTILAILAFGGAIFTVLRSPKTCAPGDVCARPWFRFSITALAIFGIILLSLSKLYA